MICFKAPAQQLSLVPMPNDVKIGANDFFPLSQGTVIVADDQKLSWYLQKELLEHTRLSLTKVDKSTKSGIYLILNTKNKSKAIDEAYHLTVSRNKVTIEANTSEGLFYGVTTFLQLVRTAQQKNNAVLIQTLTIADKPAYAWRGLMLDESRSFFGKEKVKSILDWMAFYKLNRFHWHLTDESGWRLEIKKYPLLTLIGGLGNQLDPNAPAKYYTQSDIQEIVSYAAERFITVIPEIDMPGHATAANRAYPQYSGGGTAAHPEFTFNPGIEGTYTYLSDILKETNVLFPSGLIHLGGDEVSYGSEKWKTNADILKLREREKLTNEVAVERYFMKRMADSVYQLNAKVLAWDEMVDADLPKDKTIIFWWRHDKPVQLQNALSKGYQTVLCPRLPLYFDFVQDSTHRYGRKWSKLYNPLEAVYNFDAKSFTNQEKQKTLILGIQANIWTETVPTIQRLDYLMYPRIAALAEAAWGNSSDKNFDEFMKRMKSHLNLYQEANLYYYSPLAPLFHPEPVVNKKKPFVYID